MWPARRGGRLDSYQIPEDDERLLTIEEFSRLPDLDASRLELVRGRVVREPPAGFRHSMSGADLVSRLVAYVRKYGLGEITGADGGFILFEDPPTVRAPDVGFVARERIPASGPPAGYFPGAPDFAVEIVSPSNTTREIDEKVADYLEAGTRLVWVVEPRSRSVVVHRPGREPRTYWEGDEVSGEDVVPGFRVPVTEHFEGA
jgi:Uma2 family endonuclease